MGPLSRAAELRRSRRLPWAAKARLEDLYLPEKWLTELRWNYTREEPARSIAILRDQNGDKQVRNEATQGRNDRCACNSGKKYKRCCGA
jgi:hypothetical protein